MSVELEDVSELLEVIWLIVLLLAGLEVVLEIVDISVELEDIVGLGVIWLIMLLLAGLEVVLEIVDISVDLEGAAGGNGLLCGLWILWCCWLLWLS